MLSMADFTYLRTALELLVLWGLYPYLDEGTLPPTQTVCRPRKALGCRAQRWFVVNRRRDTTGSPD